MTENTIYVIAVVFYSTIVQSGKELINFAK